MTGRRVRQCELVGCDRPHSGHGYCSMHYRRWRRTGNPLVDSRLDLTAEQVLAIREALAAGEQQVDVATRFGITQGYVSRIHHRKVWKHLP